MKYSDYLAESLSRLGYTKCFTLGGGNIMHLVESFSRHMEMIPVVHEATAAIASEHFNLLHGTEKSVVLVTTGPGITNCVTAVASAFVESRELLIIGGQVKTTDLSNEDQRQIGIQEIDGVAILRPITKAAERMLSPIVGDELRTLVDKTCLDRKGPVFLEIPLDVQARQVEETVLSLQAPKPTHSVDVQTVEMLVSLIDDAKRPVFLIGSGLDREAFEGSLGMFEEKALPIMTTWNAADYLDNRSEIFFGRPNNWGQRFANVLLQQADLLICIGARLGLQQTGFNWQRFAQNARVVQIDIDPEELQKKPHLVDIPVVGDAQAYLGALLPLLASTPEQRVDWLRFGQRVKATLPVSESSNSSHPDHWNPYEFFLDLSRNLSAKDVLLPCSSGSSFTAAYQSVELDGESRMVSSKSLASMGYGLGAAVGVAKVPNYRPVLVEGDGGFAQNLQDIGTLFRANPDSKIFIWVNDGYASIRKTQQSYFNGNYIGCDASTGLELPDFRKIFEAFNASTEILKPKMSIREALGSEINCYLVPIHPEQTFFPKISSVVRDDGGMESAPLHLMTPELSPEVAAQVLKYLD